MSVVVPKGTQPGSKEWMASTLRLAKSWGERSERDVRELVKYLSDLRRHDWSILAGHDDWNRFCRETIGNDAVALRDLIDLVTRT
jgi:hypothetical protein